MPAKPISAYARTDEWDEYVSLETQYRRQSGYLTTRIYSACEDHLADRVRSRETAMGALKILEKQCTLSGVDAALS